MVEEKTTPRNRDEQEIAGYCDVLNLIHENFDAIPITQNYIQQIHKILYSHMNNPMAGKTKSVQNYISATYLDGCAKTLFTPLSPYETPNALNRICEEYNRVIGDMEVEPLIVIPVFIHDFLCIHPFNDGNGRMSRLLTTLLLYRSGFYVGKYISLEAKIAKSNDSSIQNIAKYDNAVAENFFSILKIECIYRKKPGSFSEANEMIDRYIHFYNHERIQLMTGEMPLAQRLSA